LPGERTRPRETPEWGERIRGLIDATIAAFLLLLSTPLWALIGFEARLRRLPALTREVRIGRERRAGPRRTRRESAAIDRRSIERRTQDLLGAPIECASFHPDLGLVSRW